MEDADTSPVPYVAHGQCCRLHQAIWKADFILMQKLIDDGADVNHVDNHGLTPALLSLYLFSRNAAQENLLSYLLSKGADLSVNDKKGRKAVSLAISTGVKRIGRKVLRNLSTLKSKKLQKRLPELLNSLTSMPDFYTEIRWEIDSSFFPLFNKMAPADTLRIWKRGASIRLDSTLASWKFFSVKRRPLSVIFRIRHQNDTEACSNDSDSHLSINKNQSTFTSQKSSLVYEAWVLNHSKSVYYLFATTPSSEELDCIVDDLFQKRSTQGRISIGNLGLVDVPEGTNNFSEKTGIWNTQRLELTATVTFTSHKYELEKNFLFEYESYFKNSILRNILTLGPQVKKLVPMHKVCIEDEKNTLDPDTELVSNLDARMKQKPFDISRESSMYPSAECTDSAQQMRRETTALVISPRFNVAKEASLGSKETIPMFMASTIPKNHIFSNRGLAIHKTAVKRSTHNIYVKTAADELSDKSYKIPNVMLNSLVRPRAQRYKTTAILNSDQMKKKLNHNIYHFSQEIPHIIQNQSPHTLSTAEYPAHISLNESHHKIPLFTTGKSYKVGGDSDPNPITDRKKISRVPGTKFQNPVCATSAVPQYIGAKYYSKSDDIVPAGMDGKNFIQIDSFYRANMEPNQIETAFHGMSPNFDSSDVEFPSERPEVSEEAQSYESQRLCETSNVSSHCFNASSKAKTNNNSKNHRSGSLNFQGTRRNTADIRASVTQEYMKKATFSIDVTKEFPISLDNFLNLTRIISGHNEALVRLSEFMSRDDIKEKMGKDVFPVKVCLPLNLSLRAVMTFLKASVERIEEDVFEIPSGYLEVDRSYLKVGNKGKKRRAFFTNVLL